MRTRSRRVHAASVMSVALVAVARVARDARPSRRITCVRVPQDALAGLSRTEVADTRPVFDESAGEPAPLPPFWFEDPALSQPTEVMRVVAAVPAVEGRGVDDGGPAVEPAVADEAAVETDPAPEPPPLEPEPPLEPAAPPPPPSLVRELKSAPVLAVRERVVPEPVTAPRAERQTIPVAAPRAECQPTPVAAPATADEPTPAPTATATRVAAVAAPKSAPDVEDAWGWAEPWAFEIPDAERQRRRPSDTAGGAPRRTKRSGRRRSGRSHPLVALAVIVLVVAVSTWAMLSRSPKAGAHSVETAAVSYSPRPSAFALRTIPAAYLHDYWRAAVEYGLDWTELAAVGQIESDQGRSQTPGVAQGTNPAGAAGPAQFLGSTWARFGVDADGRGSMNPYDPADAITAMAAYLKASGAPQDWRTALYAYNHSTAYVDAVIALSRRYFGS
jgi:Transglycosylase SLT domain